MTPAIQLAKECGIVAPDANSKLFYGYAEELERLVARAQAQARKDALNEAAQICEAIAGCSYAGNAPSLRDVAKAIRNRP